MNMMLLSPFQLKKHRKSYQSVTVLTKEMPSKMTPLTASENPKKASPEQTSYIITYVNKMND